MYILYIKQSPPIFFTCQSYRSPDDTSHTSLIFNFVKMWDFVILKKESTIKFKQFDEDMIERHNSQNHINLELKICK